MRYVASAGSVLYHIAREVGSDAPSLCGWRPKKGWERIHSAEVRDDGDLEEPGMLLVCERCDAACRRLQEIGDDTSEDERPVRLTLEEAGVLEGAVEWVLSVPRRRRVAVPAGKVVVLESAVKNLRRQHAENLRV